MATLVDTATVTGTEMPAGAAWRKTQRSNGQTQMEKPRKKLNRKFNHVFAFHRREKASPLGKDALSTPSFFGFKNLMALMLIVSNLRLMIENFRKYGVLICISCHAYRSKDLKYGSIIYFSVPVHLLVAFCIEHMASRAARRAVSTGQRTQNGSGNGTPGRSLSESSWKFEHVWWYFIAVAHALNATLNLAISTYVVYYHIYHPGIGTLVELHAIIVWLKVCSYALTNRDLRHAYLSRESDDSIPELYASCPYPENITISNLCYFWWAPTLVYQPVYPRTRRIRRSFVVKRALESIGLSIVIWIVSAQYAAPLLQNSLDKMASLDVVSILERLMKLSTISLFCWLCGFYALFHSFLNALAEVLRFADRDFYSDWWNVSTVRTYWTSWNKPVYYFMHRHIYSPMIGRGVPPPVAQFIVYLFSGALHELLVGVPTHNIIGVAMMGMLGQIPLILLTDPFGSNPSYAAKVTGNTIFWVSFCLVGQPLAAMMYFFAWQMKYGGDKH